MKKLLIVCTVLTFSLLLSGCEKEIDLDPKYDILEETPYILNELPYSEYLNLTNPEITITVKDMGDIVLQLFPNVAPNTVASFIRYIEEGSFTDNEFHRVMVDFMIQGGQIDNPSCTIQAEANNNPDFNGTNDLQHYRGVISMARTTVFNSATSQFFIVHQDSTFLDGDYAGFGGVVSGFNILDFIANMNDGVTQVPYDNVYIEGITVDLKGQTYDLPVCLN